MSASHHTSTEHLKNRINRSLTRLTGYHLAKGLPGEELARLQGEARGQQRGEPAVRAPRADAQLAREEARRATQRANRLEKQAQAIRETAAEVNRRADDRAAADAIDDAALRPIPGYVDLPTRELIASVQPLTTADAESLYALIDAVRYIVRYEVGGDVVECGVGGGGTMQAVARTLVDAGDTTRQLYLFDTFGAPVDPSPRDVRSDGRRADDLAPDALPNGSAEADVMKAIDATEYPRDRIHLVNGDVRVTLPDLAPQDISILRIDTAFYYPTDHELRHLWERLVPSGVLIIGSCDRWDGAREALEEFTDGVPERLYFTHVGTSRVVVKPWA